MHTFAKYLFNTLYSYDVDLAFRVGLRAMRLPVLEDTEEGDEGRDAAHVPIAAPSRFPRWFTLAHIEDEQCDIAATMLSAAKGTDTEPNSCVRLWTVLFVFCRRWS
jgi:hypothetical protein